MMETPRWLSRAGKSPRLFTALVLVILEILVLLDMVMCVCVCLCTQIIWALFGLLDADVACSCRNLCNLMVANVKESPRKIPLHHLKLLPTDTLAHVLCKQSHNTAPLYMFRHFLLTLFTIVSASPELFSTV